MQPKQKEQAGKLNPGDPGPEIPQEKRVGPKGAKSKSDQQPDPPRRDA